MTVGERRASRLGIAVVAIVGVLLAVVPMNGARAAGAAQGQCADNVGITIVVDFRDLGGGVNIACAPSQVSDGLDALSEAGVSWEGTRRYAGLVCRIAGKPSPASEACVNAPPAAAYWSYWIAPRGGHWCYSSLGAGNRVPPPGSVEGWSFSLNHTGGDVPPPSSDPPAPIPGTTPTQLRGGDCGAPPPSTPPATDAPFPPAAGDRSTAPTPGGGAAHDNPQPTAQAGPTGASEPDARGAATSTTTAASRATGDSTAVDAASSSSASRASSDASASKSGEVALNAVDLTDDGRGGSGTPLGVIGGTGLVAALGGGAWFKSRKRHRVENLPIELDETV
ncbi:MAG: hypothetical protein ACR2LQ_11425 [Acidimicrobiales bacterium]